jgi:hypothetical protein
MADYSLKVDFFNTFILRFEDKNELFVEESRIKGGFNEPFVSNGPKAHLVDENYAENRRENALIYSGIYNSRTDVNKTNVFNAAEKITRAVDPQNGSIQKLHAEDTNLNIFQEDKVSYALIDKDAIFTAEGGNLTASGAKVIGQIVPYLGKYGISKNPESFAFKGNRKYFADKNRGAILRLSRDGITEISQAGMRDYFKDNLKLADKVVGSYDDSSDQYSVSLQGDNMSDGYDTLTFDETSKGWPSFYSYKPDFGFSMNKEYYTLNNNDIWKHYSNTSYNNFYGVPYSSTIKFLANDNPSLVKNFLAINYEGDSNWKMKSATTDLNMEAFRVYGNNDTSDVAGNTLTGDILPKFIKKENKYYAQLINKNPGTGEGQVIGVEIAGITGFFNTVEMTNGSDLEIELFNVSHTIVKSS